jgi:hypothetical protein
MPLRRGNIPPGETGLVDQLDAQERDVFRVAAAFYFALILERLT